MLLRGTPVREGLDDFDPPLTLGCHETVFLTDLEDDNIGLMDQFLDGNFSDIGLLADLVFILLVSSSSLSLSLKSSSSVSSSSFWSEMSSSSSLSILFLSFDLT